MTSVPPQQHKRDGKAEEVGSDPVRNMYRGSRSTYFRQGVILPLSNAKALHEQFLQVKQNKKPTNKTAELNKLRRDIH